jgi:hypothetical protein
MSKWKMAAVLAIGLAVGLSAPASRAELPPHGTGKQAAPKAKKLEIAFTGAVMTIDGKRFTLPAEEKALVTVLGQPDRRAELANTILTWDDLGVFAYIRSKTTTCHAFAITLGKDTPDFWPKKPFPGRLTVDGAELRSDSALDDVNDVKKGKPFKPDDVLTDVWTIDHKEGSLYLRRAPTAKTGFIKLELGIPSG